MKAFRNIGGNVVEISVDLDLSGNPILPPNTTVEPRPEVQDGHYLAVVGNSWVQIPVPVVEVTLEQIKQEALGKLKAWRNWKLEQPFVYEEVLFDADETARARLSQAVVIGEVSGVFPPAWVAQDNSMFPIVDYSALKALGIAMSVEFSARYFEASTLREAIEAATSKAEVEAVVIPSITML